MALVEEDELLNTPFLNRNLLAAAAAVGRVGETDHALALPGPPRGQERQSKRPEERAAQTPPPGRWSVSEVNSPYLRMLLQRLQPLKKTAVPRMRVPLSSPFCSLTHNPSSYVIEQLQGPGIRHFSAVEAVQNAIQRTIVRQLEAAQQQPICHVVHTHVPGTHRRAVAKGVNIAACQGRSNCLSSAPTANTTAARALLSLLSLVLTV